MSDLAVEYVSLESILPYARNARTHSAEQITALASIIAEFGWRVPVLIDERGVLIAGHGRVLAAKRLKMETVPAFRCSDMTPQQVKAYRLAENQIATQSGWNPDMLKLELTELHMGGFDMGLLAFDPVSLATAMGLDGEPPPPPPIKDGAKELGEEGFQDFDHRCPKCGFEFDNA